VTGWEERGPDWRGFASGGAKILFRLGALDGLRLLVTEAAIDAMSLASLEGFREESLYLSTGGGWSPATAASMRSLADRPGTQLVAATDANAQGEAFAVRLREIAEPRVAIGSVSSLRRKTGMMLYECMVSAAEDDARHGAGLGAFSGWADRHPQGQSTILQAPTNPFVRPSPASVCPR
jgi:hypothetical protein